MLRKREASLNISWYVGKYAYFRGDGTLLRSVGTDRQSYTMHISEGLGFHIRCHENLKIPQFRILICKEIGHVYTWNNICFEDRGHWKRKHHIALCGELALEEAMDLSWGRINEWWTGNVARKRDKNECTILVRSLKAEAHFEDRKYGTIAPKWSQGDWLK